MLLISLTRKTILHMISNIHTTKMLKMLFIAILMISPLAISIVFAQPGPPPPPVPPPGVPIDGGILLLLSGLAAYGAKKVFNK